MHSSSLGQPSLGEFQLDCSGLRLAGLRLGTSGAAPALALHGWLDNAASFLPLAPWLADRDLLAPDWPGHGRSDHRPAGTWSPFLDYVWDLLQMVDQLEWPRLDLIGHSMGGAVACLFAACFPERVRKLVLIETIGPMSQPDDRFVPQLRRALLARQGFRDKRRVYASLEEPIQARMQAGQLSEPVARLLMERGTRTVEGGHVFTTDPRELLPSLSRGADTQMLASLAAITAPTQVLLADPATSYLSGPAADARLAALRPQQVHRLQGNHHLHMEHPDVLGPLIAEFLAD